MRISRRILAVVPLFALVLAGCGGGGSDSTESTAAETTEAPALTKAELIAQGDAICAEVNAAVGTVGSTNSAASSATAQVAGLYDGMVERLKGLGAPRDESAGYPEFISAAEALAQAEDDVKLASEREEGTALSAAEAEASSALSEFQSASSSFGFEQCAEAPAAPTPSGGSAEAGEEEGSGGTEEESVEEAAPEEEAEAAPETGGAGSVEEESAGGGAGVGGGSEGGGSGGSSGGIGPG